MCVVDQGTLCKVLCARCFNISLSSGFYAATAIPWTSCCGKAVVGNNLIVNGVLLLVKLLLLKMARGTDSVRSTSFGNELVAEQV